MRPDQRPEYRAAEIQHEADYGMSPERLAYRETCRQKITAFVLGMLEKIEPGDVGGDDETATSQ